LQEALQYIGAMNDNTQTQNSEWRHVQTIWDIAGSTEASDRAVTTFDIVNVTGAAIDNSWTDADYNSVNSDISGLCTLWLAHMPTSARLVGINYYRRSFNPLSNQQPFTKSGPPERSYTYNNAGTGTGVLVRQVASTTTDRTTYPRHWGRNYWPFLNLASSSVDASGYLVPAFTDAWGLAVHDQYANMMNKEFFPVVPVTQVAGVPTRGLLGITQIQMDNLPDIVRRRRPKLATHKYVSAPLP